MLTVFSEDHRLHAGTREFAEGEIVDPFEKPARAEMVVEAVRAAGLGEIIPPERFGRAPVERIHRPAYLDFLSGAWDAWVAEHGERDALPFVWPGRSLRQAEPDNIDGRLGYWAFDAGTPIVAGTWQAALSSAEVALTAQRRIADGARAAFALCRPPGHHAASDLYGGYCFLNNAAIAAQAARDQGAQRVAILDIDYHHGNGTQEIFYARDDVLFLSIHADPRQEYPYFLGHADERGHGKGEGFNVNYPLPWGADFSAWRAALTNSCRRIGEFGPDLVVISLGVDTYEGDPISRFRLSEENFSRVGETLAGLNLPTLFCMEGGYAVEEIGRNVVRVLTGFSDR